MTVLADDLSASEVQALEHEDRGTYPAPRHGWVCFHCGEHFPSTEQGEKDARDHFGDTPIAMPACIEKLTAEERSFLHAFREQEEALRRYRDEDSDKDRQMASMSCEHGRALREEEEKGYERGMRDMRAELLGKPELKDFAAGVMLEAQHQRVRWGAQHDTGKSAADWFWLIGYLAQKAMYSHLAGDSEKAMHHCITTAAAMANWHAAVSGADNSMRPGIETPKDAAA